MDTDHTVAIAANAIAKRYDAKTGTRILDAKRMCQDLRCVLARHDVYVRYHHRILAEVIRHIAITRVCSIDELSSRLPPGKRSRRGGCRRGARQGGFASQCRPGHHLLDRHRAEKFGADTIQLGVVPETEAGYVATKISFTRIPELAEFSQ